MFKKRYGFTIIETALVMMVLGVIVTVTVVSIMNSDKAKEKQILATTQSYYANIENIYQQILAYNSKNGVITAIEDKNSDSKVDKEDLRELFNYYMSGVSKDCSELGLDVNDSTTEAKYLKQAVCSEHAGKVIAGYYLNPACNETVSVKETYTPDDKSSRTVTNACGYIIYGIKGLKAQAEYTRLGNDVFVIGLGKIGLK